MFNLKDYLNQYTLSLDPAGRPAVPTHVMILGTAGTSKTYTARQVIATRPDFVSVELHCHASITAFEMWGSYTPSATGSLVWMDGPLTQAFRIASTGQRVCLLIDEILRTESRALSILLTALTPHPTTGKLILKTQRAVKVAGEIGEPESIEIDPKNLAIIATSNIGANYQVESLDPAIQDRFTIFMQTQSKASVQAIMASALDSKRKEMAADYASAEDAIKSKLPAWQFPPSSAAQIATFWQSVESAVKSGELSKGYSVRLLTRALETSYGDPAKFIAQIATMKNNVVQTDPDGNPVEAESKKLDELIATHLTAKLKAVSASMSASAAVSLATSGSSVRIQLANSDIKPAAIASVFSGLKRLGNPTYTGNWITTTFRQLSTNSYIQCATEAETRELWDVIQKNFPTEAKLLKLEG